MDTRVAKRTDNPASAEQVLEDRIDGLADWLRSNPIPAGREQAHLGAETPEQAYWHYGYLMALRDVRDLLTGRRSALN